MSSEMDSLMYEAADRVDYDEVAETYSGYDKPEKECPDKHETKINMIRTAAQSDIRMSMSAFR